MLKTLSLYPVCYKKIEAIICFTDGQSIMDKACDVHGLSNAIPLFFPVSITSVPTTGTIILSYTPKTPVTYRALVQR